VTAPDPRAELAAGLEAGWRAGAPFVVAEGSATRMDFGRYADALLPVVERFQRQAAAKATREAIGAVLGSCCPEHAVSRLREQAEAMEAAR
jgi:hypothetical protein